MAEPTPSRPIGWWLKEADARLDAAFDSALSGRGVDRRGWQVLATLARSATPRGEVKAALVAFDESAVVDSVIDSLRDRGCVEESEGLLRLTADGMALRASLAPVVERVRRMVAEALPGDDYRTLIRLLSRLVAALPEPTR